MPVAPPCHVRTFLSVVLMVAAATTVSAQVATFRSSTHLVPVATTVVDPNGRLVSGLERDEFTLLDNGRPQEITFFRNDAQPFTVVVMLDYSASMTANLQLLKHAAEEFVQRLLPSDRGQVASFSDTIAFSGRFTSNHEELIDTLDELPFGDRTRLYDAISESIGQLRDVDGRKIVLVFTDGDDTASVTGFGRVLDQARDAGVTVSAIRLDAAASSGAARPAKGSRPLIKLAEETGGGYFELTRADELAATFARVAQELHSGYTLCFSPVTLDGRDHTLSVRIKRPAMNARARKSYVASALY